MSEERSILEEVTPMETIQPLQFEEQPSKKMDFGFLKAPTGEGAVGDYLEHPLNFNSSKGMARILRGLTGIIGDLDLAIVDIAVGLLDLLKTNKKVGTNYDNGVNPFR